MEGRGEEIDTVRWLDDGLRLDDALMSLLCG